MASEEEQSTELPAYTFADFLLQVAPNEVVRVTDMWRNKGGSPDIMLPQLLPLYCSHCGGERYFFPTEAMQFYSDPERHDFIHYKCRNCGDRIKTYAVALLREESGGRAVKYGESPPFGVFVQPDVEKLLGNSVELFRKGLEAESRGLGIGAFAYYRRVLETQRINIFDQVIKVAKKLDADESVIAPLEAAKNERQFTKSMEALKAGPLKAIYIDGHNPLTLLHDAVSDGLHAQSDAENLSNAQTVRLLLSDLARRIDDALADHEEVTNAVTRLLQAKAARQKRSGIGTDNIAKEAKHRDTGTGAA